MARRISIKLLFNRFLIYRATINYLFRITVLILFLIITEGCALNSYRITSLKVPNNSIDFIIPPHSHFKTDQQSGMPEECYRYQYVFITDLNSDYYHCLDRINKATYRYDNDSIFDREANKDYVVVSDSDGYFKIGYSKEIPPKKIIIQLDYQEIFKSKKQLDETFCDLSFRLLNKLDDEENKINGELPYSICQNIVETVFELMPIPQEASLFRYGYKNDKSKGYSFIILNPSIRLVVDQVDKYQQEEDEFFRFDLESTIKIDLFKEHIKSKGYKAVYFKQIPYFAFNEGSVPSNRLKEGNIHLASSGDIDFSNKINTSKYLILYQGYFKKNNSINLDGRDQMECKDYHCCSSYLLYANSISELSCIITGSHNDIPYKPPTNNFATFGERNLILPKVPIYINSEVFYYPFSIKLCQLTCQKLISDNYDLFRLYRGSYKQVKTTDKVIYILPGDKFILKR